VDDDAAAVRAEWRAEEDQWSRAALEHWEHSRTLADVLRDAHQRGDVVSFAFPSTTWSGVIRGVGHDVVRIDPGDGNALDVRIGPDVPFVLHLRDAARQAPWSRDPLTTFRARLRELDGSAVRIGSSVGALEGTLRIGRDQVRVTAADGGAAYVPTGSIWWVRPPADD
jgi:hypothetical protein